MKHRVNTHQNSSEPNFIKLLQNHEASRQILAFIFIALMSLAANANPLFINLALILIVFGAIFRLIASGVIVKNKELCTIGIYSLVRHPLYTGNLLILIGFSFLANMIAWYVLLTAFIIFYYPPAIKYEDEKLKNIFNDQWKEWAQNTPALIPKRLALDLFSNWSFRNSVKLNGEPIILLYVFIWAYVAT